MHYLYIIYSDSSEYLYFGVTNNPHKRWLEHLRLIGKKETKLYNWLTKYKDTAKLDVLEVNKSRHFILNKEVCYIENARVNGWSILNLAKGGVGGFVIQDVDSWRKKLVKARKGRTPAKGMKHSDKNKKLFSKVSRLYWEGNVKYHNTDEILKLSHREAKKVYGISTTHYYRLRKKSGNLN